MSVKKLGLGCLSVCLSVCSSTLAAGAQTAGSIGAGVVPFDAAVRRNDDGDGPESVGATWHVARAAA